MPESNDHRPGVEPQKPPQQEQRCMTATCLECDAIIGAWRQAGMDFHSQMVRRCVAEHLATSRACTGGRLLLTDYRSKAALEAANPDRLIIEEEA